MEKSRNHIPDFGVIEKAIRKSVNKKLIPAAQKIAEDERDMFVKEIEKQKFKAFHEKPLSPPYLKRKIAAGADERVMIATGDYHKKIMVKTVKERTTTRIGIILPPRARARDMHGKLTKTLLTLVANVQEHGSLKVGVPPRPHWGPHFRAMRTRAQKYRVKIAQEIVKDVKADLKNH